MTKRHVNTFAGGIDRDTSVNKYDNKHYYDAENIRPISNNTFSSGAITNVDGLLEKIDFSSITYTNLDSAMSVESVTVFKTISIRDTLVFFVQLNLRHDVSGLYIGHNAILKSTPNTSGNFVSVDIVYLYYDARENPINFSLDMSVVGRYETSTIQKVYWANGQDPLRVVNINNVLPTITDPAYNDIAPSELDHIPNVVFSNITIDDIVSGGIYSSGAVQYAYQLYNKNGEVSTISPVTNPVLLSSFSQEEVGGSEIGEDSNKSVQLSIDNLDTNFNRVRIIALFYDELFSNPSVNIVTEQENIGSISFTDTGNVIDTMSYEEFLVFNQTTYSPKSIESKNNILFSANVEESTFQSDVLESWDSRVYMYDELTDSFTIFNNGSSEVYTDWAAVAPDNDALSPGSSNFQTLGPDYYNSSPSRSIHQRNSSVIGGEGPNLKFEYTIGLSELSSGLGTYVSGNSLTNKNNVKGLQPGEVYRFGIVFYNNKGQSSFAKWIQDIRIPYATELGIADSGPIDARSINIEFTIKPGSFPNDPDIAGWQIVRVKREAQDREILYSGMLLNAQLRDGEDFADSYLELHPDYNGTTIKTYLSGKPTLEEYYNPNHVEYESVEASTPLWEFISPEVNFNRNVPDLTNCKILISHQYFLDEAIHEELAGIVHSFCRAEYFTVSNWPTIVAATDIKDYQIVSPPSFGTDQVYNLGSTPKELFSNFTRPKGTQLSDNIGIGGTKLIINSDIFGLQYNIDNSFGTGWPAGYTTRFGAHIIKDVSNTRYGGNTYESRQLNTYIPYGGINSSSQLTDTTNIASWNGDTYLKMFTYLRNIFQYKYPVTDWGIFDALQEVINFPVYTSINLDYRSDAILKYLTYEGEYSVDSDGIPRSMMVQETVAKGIEYQPEYYNEDIGDLYTYNSVYSKQNEAKKFYPKPFDFVDSSRIDNKIIASEVKSNGEYLDSWLQFKANNFIEVESEYGPIIRLERFMNHLFCFQLEGVSLLAVNDRSLINDGSGIQLALGTGGVLERYDYISNEKGISNPNALVASKQALYFIDEINKEFNLIDGSNIREISRIKGFSSEINSLIPSSKILTGYDPVFKEIYLTFDGATWVFSELTGGIIGKFSVNPHLYLSHRGGMYSIDSGSLYIHNDPASKLGDKSYITLLINPNSNVINSFDNLDFRTDVSLNNSQGYIKGIKVNYSTVNEDRNISQDFLFSNDYIEDDNGVAFNYVSYNLTNDWRGESDREIIITVDESSTSNKPSFFKLGSFGLHPYDTDITNVIISVTGDFNTYTKVWSVDTIVSGGVTTIDFSTITPTLNLSINDTVDRIKYSNSYIPEIVKETKLNDPNKTVSSLARMFRTQVPLTSSGNRFTDSYLLATFEFDNIDNLKFKLHDVISYYRDAKI